MSVTSKMDLQDKTPPKRRVAPKKTWSTPERFAARKIFREHISNKFLPTPTECSLAIKNHKELTGRTVNQIKAWVNNQIKKKKS